MGDKQNFTDNVIDFRSFFFRIVNNWFYFLLSILLFLFIAFMYTRYTVELYESSMKIQVDNDDMSTPLNFLNSELSDSRSLNIDDDIESLIRYPLIFQTISDSMLRYDIQYSIVGNIKTTETYDAPVILEVDTSITQSNINLTFNVNIIDKDNFLISNEDLNLEKKASFGERIEIVKGCPLIVNRNNTLKNDKLITNIRFRSLNRVALDFQSKLRVEKKSKESNTLSLFILQEDQKKGSIFLNKLLEKYIESDEKYKQAGPLKAVAFIDEKIAIMEDTLIRVERQLQDYQNANQVIDLDEKTSAVYNNISKLQISKDRYSSENKMYSYIQEAINSDDSESLLPYLPSDGQNVSLLKSIEELKSKQAEKKDLLEDGLIDNPEIENLDQETDRISADIEEIVQNSIDYNREKIRLLNNQIKIEEVNLGTLPANQRKLKSIERILRTNETHYIHLLNKREDAGTTASAIVSDIRVLEPSTYFKKKIVFPNSSNVYTVCLLIGFILPIVILLFIDLLDDKIRSRVELEKIISAELIGVIGRNHSGHTLLTRLNPKSSIVEGFRALRSNLEYHDQEGKNKVFLVTSSISGEGKTFLSSNLAIVYASSGKKTLLLGGDLRRPKLYQEFDKENQKGLSSILTGDTNLNDVIIKTDMDNLDVIVSGPTPQNPSDIFLGEKFSDLIQILKKKYDKIIIDTAPLGLVADAYMIMKYSDVNLYVVRQDYTEKNILRFVNDLNSKERIDNLYLILNDVSTGTGVYGYGKYGYGRYGYGGYGRYGYSYSSYVKDSDYFDDTET